MFGAEPEPAQPIISSLLVVEYLTPPQTPSRAAGSCMGALRTVLPGAKCMRHPH